MNEKTIKNSQEAQYIKMTKTPISSLIIKLSIPTIITMMITNIYNMVDQAFIGKLGTSASGAVGIVFGFMAILQAVGFLFGQGAGSMISRALGRKDKEEAGKIASTGFFLAFTISILVALVCLIFLDKLVILLGSTPTIAPYAKTYTTYILISAPFIVTSFTMNNFLRYEGRASLGMIGMLTGAVLNIGGDALFMFKFNMGIAGAGLSTCLSQIVSFIILLSFFFTGKTQCVLSFKNISGNLPRIGNIVATGAPSLIRQSLQSVSTILLNSLAGPYGDAAIAAMSIVSRIVFFIFSVALGIAQGFQPVCAFNFGAKKFKRVREAFWFSFKLAEICIVIVTIAVLIKNADIVALFRDDPEVIRIGTRALMLQALTQLFTPFGTITEMSLQTSGYKLFASIMSSLKNGILFMPTLYFMAIWRGLNGIEEAQPIANIIILIPSIIFAIYYFKQLPKEDVPDAN